jgi:hypothetical protein
MQGKKEGSGRGRIKKAGKERKEGGGVKGKIK